MIAAKTFAPCLTQAEAMAQSIKDQIKLELIPGWNSEAELYSEAARTHLRPPPVKKAA